MTRWQPHHRVWATLFAVWAFSYADRTITGPVVTWMIEDRVAFLQDAARPYALGGLLGSPFFAGYMLTQFPGGYFGDRYGHRAVIVISIFWAGVTTVCHTVTIENAPASLHGSALGMWNLVAEIGAVLSPVVSGALRDATGSWTAQLLLDGVLMAATCLLVLAISAKKVRGPAVVPLSVVSTDLQA